MDAVVLAAGEGERLAPLTESRPKPMLPAANRPILSYVFDALVAAGVDSIVVVIGYERDHIRDQFGNAYRDNYGIGILVSGDGDYVPAVKEAKRQGKVIALAVFDHKAGGVSDKLRMQCDFTIDLCRTLLEESSD